MPSNEIQLTINELHCKETAGHLGTDKTIEKIKSRFFWINLSRDVKKFIQEGYDCQKVKPPKVYCKPKLMPLAPSRTLQLITMDMAGPLPLTKEGHKYILAICDHFTKHIKVFPMKTMTAIEVAERCLDYCLTFGIPESVLTDQGTNFTSQVIESLWEPLDVHTLRTTAYHPQTDGITERFNRTIKTMLTQFVNNQKQDNWDTKLEKLSFAYNTAVHAVTKFSPFELMFGRIPKLPIDLVYDQTDANELKAKIEVEWIASDFVDQQRKEMKAMFDLAAANRDAASLRASTLYDRTVRGANFKVGDKVWVLDQGTKIGTNPKLRPRWKGPYLVTDMFNEVNAILKADGRSRKTKIVHLCKLKKCFGKPQVVAISNEDTINENSQISNSFDPVSPAPNRKREEGRMACPNANANATANASKNELTVGQPLDLVSDIEEDDHSMTVDSQNKGSPVNKLLSKGHRSKMQDVLPSTSRATKSTQSPIQRPILNNLAIKTTQKQSRLEEIIEEDQGFHYDETSNN